MRIYILLLITLVSGAIKSQAVVDFPINVIFVFEDISQTTNVNINNDVINSLNSVFGPSGITFSVYNSSPHLLVPSIRAVEAEDNYYTFEQLRNLAEINNNPNKINLYILPYSYVRVEDNFGALGTGEFPESYIITGIANDAGKFSTSSNSVFISTNSEIDFQGLLVHEFGHFFGLFHTFSSATQPNLLATGIDLLFELSRVNDFIDDTPACLNIQTLKKSSLYLDYKDSPDNCPHLLEYLCGNKVLSALENDPFIWNNYMNYGDGLFFTEGQYKRMSDVKFLEGRINLSSTQLTPAYAVSLNQDEKSIDFEWIVSESSAKSSVKSNEVYRLQITKDLKQNFTFNTGYKSSWYYGGNNEVVVDTYITAINGSISFIWSDTKSQGIFEEPIPGTRYKATLAKEYPDPNNTGFSSFSDEVIIDFGEILCTQPKSLEALTIGLNTASLKWETVSNTDEYQVMIYRGGNIVQSHRTSENELSIGALENSTEYCFDVQALCLNGDSDVSYATCFTTSSCPNITNVQVSERSYNKASISWEGNGSDTYVINYGFPSSLDDSLMTAYSFVDLINLVPNTSYCFQIEGSCNDGSKTQSEEFCFTTLEQGQRDARGDFSVSYSLNQSSVEAGDDIHVTTFLSYQYEDSNEPFTYRPDVMYYLSPVGDEEDVIKVLRQRPVNISKSFGSSQSTVNELEIMKVPEVSPGMYQLVALVDPGNNQVESNENNNLFMGNIIIKKDIGCTDVMSHNYTPTATIDNGQCQTCTDGIRNGDEHQIDCGGSLCSPCPSPCFSANNLKVSQIDPIFVNLTWSDIGAQSYLIHFKNKESGLERTVSTDNTIVTLSDLTPGVDYEWYVQSLCSASFNYSEIKSFRTLRGIYGCMDLYAHNHSLRATHSAVCETCNDGIMNGDEIEIDCGGRRCDPCDCQLDTIAKTSILIGPDALNAKKAIILEDIIHVKDKVDLHAGNEIIFQPGTTIYHDAILEVEIEECEADCWSSTPINIDTMTSTSISFSWRSSEIHQEIKIKLTSASDEERLYVVDAVSGSLNISDLNENTQYTIQVETICENGLISDKWVKIFQTLNAETRNAYGDLFIENVNITPVVSEYFCPSEGININYRMVYDGTENGLDVNLSFHLSDDLYLDATDALLGKENIEINTCENAECDIEYSLPNGLRDKNYYVLIIVDEDDYIIETNENNNEVHKNIEILCLSNSPDYSYIRKYNSTKPVWIGLRENGQAYLYEAPNGVQRFISYIDEWGEYVWRKGPYSANTLRNPSVTSNGDLLIANSRDIHCIDSNGNEKWSKRLLGGTTGYGNSLTPYLGEMGNIYLVRTENDNGVRDNGIGFAKFDGQGNKIFETFFVHAGSSTYTAKSINILQQDDFIYIFGSYDRGNTRQFPFVLCTNTSGQMIWEHTFGQYSNAAVSNLLITNEAIYGFLKVPDNSSCKYFKMNVDGSFEWIKEVNFVKGSKLFVENDELFIFGTDIKDGDTPRITMIKAKISNGELVSSNNFDGKSGQISSIMNGLALNDSVLKAVGEIDGQGCYFSLNKQDNFHCSYDLNRIESTISMGRNLFIYQKEFERVSYTLSNSTFSDIETLNDNGEIDSCKGFFGF